MERSPLARRGLFVIDSTINQSSCMTLCRPRRVNGAAAVTMVGIMEDGIWVTLQAMSRVTL